MKICAVICEYNPFHTGHLYQLREAAKQFDRIICIMSGNFVQRAEPAIVERTLRARTALECGASMVVELPVIYATANGERFAGGAVRTLAALGDIDGLVMGCETDDGDALIGLARIQADEPDELKAVLNEGLSAGKSYAAAYAEATAVCAAKEGIDPAAARALLSGANNLLCIEYIKAMQRCGMKTRPVFIKRVGNAHNNFSMKGSYLSASALRKLIGNGDYSAALPYLPGCDEAMTAALRSHTPDLRIYSAIAVAALRSSTPIEIGKAFDCREGLEYKIYETAALYPNLGDILENVKSKRYTMSRLRRIVLQFLLGITRDLMDGEPYVPARLLAIKEDFKPFLSEVGGKLIIRGEDLGAYRGEYYDRYFAVEKRAAAIYSAITADKDLFAPGKLVTL